MSEQNSKFTIDVQTKGDVSGVELVNQELQKTVVVTKDAAAAGKVLTTAHKDATKAAEGHANSNSTLRLASRGANDASFALADLLQGNFVTAIHRGKFAVEDLGIAMKTAFAPSAIILGITLGVEVLSHLVTSTDEATEATKKQGAETDKTKAKVDEYAEGMKKLGRAIAESATNEEALAERIKAQAAAADEILEPLKKQLEIYKEMRRAKDELLDSKSAVELANIEGAETAGLITPEEARGQRTGVRLRDAGRKVSSEREEIQQELNERGGQVAGETQNQQAASAALNAAKSQYATALEELTRLRPGFKLRPGESIADRASLERSKAEAMESGAIPGDKVDARQQADLVSALADADMKLASARKDEVEATKRLHEQEKAMADAARTATPRLEALKNRDEEIQVQLNTEETRQALQRQNENREHSKEDDKDDAATRKTILEEQLRQIQDSRTRTADPQQLERLKQSEAGVRFRLAGEIEDPDRRRLEQEDIRTRERARLEKENPGALARSEAGSLVNQFSGRPLGTVSGDNAANLKNQLNKGGSDEQLIAVLQQMLQQHGNTGDQTALMLDIIRQLKADLDRQKSEQARAHHELQTLKSQLHNSRS